MKISQRELLLLIEPKLLNAPRYEKFTKVYAREAIQGEKITTITSGIKETVNYANDSDFVIRNTTSSLEEYIINNKKFHQRYEPIHSSKQGWKEYKAKGKCRAILVDKNVLEMMDLGQEFTFEAPWGEPMICKAGDMLVCPSDYGNIEEVYRIGAKEFEETYRLIIEEK